jgi:hypothetical protein
MTTVNVVGGYVTATKNLTEQRKKMTYKVDTCSTTQTGVVPIRGGKKYPEEPSIFFTREAWVKQCRIVEKCPLEVGWFALVDHDEDDNSFTITELIIPEQIVTATETDIGKEALADAAMLLINQGKDTSKMYAWFHSHVNMGVGPSAQDELQVEDFLEDLADQLEIPAFIRGIQNKQGALKLDVYYVQHGIAYQNVEHYVLHDDDPQWEKDIDTTLLANVKTRTYAPTYNNAYRGNGGALPPAGKPLNQFGGGSEIANVNGFRRGNYWDDYDDVYGNEYYGDSYAHRVLTTSASDTPNLPQPVNLPYMAQYDMDIVYNVSGNSEVLMDNAGKLWFCDGKNDLYDYDEYVEAYGDLDDVMQKAL